MGLFRLESLKMIRNKKNMSLMLIIILFASLFFLYNTVCVRATDKLGQYQQNASTLKQNIDYIQKDPDKSEAKNRALKETRQQESLQEEQISAHEAGNWKKELEIQIILDKNFVQQVQSGSVITDNQAVVQSQKEIQFDTQLVRNNIQPSTEPFETEGINFAYRILFSLFPYLMILFVAVLISDISAKEKKDGTSNLANIFPVKLKKILDTRILVSFLYSFIIVIVPLIFALLIGTIFNKFGSINYPIEISASGNNNDWIPIIQFFARSILLIMSLLIFLSVFIQFLSTFINNSLLLMLIIIGSFFFSQIISSVKTALYNYVHVIPFTFADVPRIVDGKSMVKFGNPYVTTTNGMITLLLSSVILYLFTLLIITKRKEI